MLQLQPTQPNENPSVFCVDLCSMLAFPFLTAIASAYSSSPALSAYKIGAELLDASPVAAVAAVVANVGTARGAGLGRSC